MPKTSGQKRRIIALREILLDRTDENNYITMAEILKELTAEGLEADKRTINEDIETLIDIGDDIVRDEERKAMSYAVLSREFELQELKLLLDCVQVSKFLSKEKTDKLTEKLYKLCSRHERKQLQGQVYRNHVKNDNELIYIFIDAIHTAIAEHNAITFKYCSYLPSKVKQPRHGGKDYIVYPLALVYSDENYYLIACECKGESHPDIADIKHFRIDRMQKVKTDCERKFDKENPSLTIDIDNYTKQNFSMYGGNMERVTMQFPDYLAGVVLDRFGMDARIIKGDNGYFEVTESIAVSPQFYGWIFGLSKDVKIISPAHIAQEMKDLLQDTYKIYTIPRNRKKKS